ncbi:MAG: hypothetical protein KF819_28670 [Labilithrix sp.]|nr:hypothetical protein [Labilithrix sp.]
MDLAEARGAGGAKFKGLVLVNARDFCRDRFGPSGWDRVIDALPTADRAVIAGVVQVGWYDLALYDRVHETIEVVHGRDASSIMTELGHYCAERDLTTVHRLFLRMASVGFVLGKYGEYWRRYQDSGEWTVSTEGPRRVRGTLSGWGSTSEATCARLAAYVERFCELCGAKGARVTRARCRTRGDRVCEYLIEWRGGLGITS